MSTSGNGAARGTLAELAALLMQAEADLADAPRAAETERICVLAWRLWEELAAATDQRSVMERKFAQAVACCQGACADDRDGAQDPMAHIRGFLARHGKTPPAGVTAEIACAWADGLPAESSRWRHPRVRQPEPPPRVLVRDKPRPPIPACIPAAAAAIPEVRRA